MKYPILTAILSMILSSLACSIQVNDPAPLAITATPTETATARPAATSQSEIVRQTATVKQAMVNVRDSAGGDVTGEYITQGQEVTILRFDKTGNWVEIAEPRGWVWSGCLEGLNEKGCVAK